METVDSHRLKSMAIRIKGLIAVRLILVTIITIAGPFILNIEKVPFYTIFASFYLVSLIYVILLKTNLSLSFQAYLQIIIDTILETAIIHCTGGVDSVYAFLYMPSIITAGVVISSRAAKTLAGLSSIFYIAITGMEYSGIIAPVLGAEALYKEGLFVVMLIVFFRVIIFCLVGYLSSYLAYNLAKERVELVKMKNLSDVILKNISSGVLTLDKDLYIIYANPMAQRLLGRAEKEIIGAYLPGLIWERPDMGMVDRFITHARTSGSAEIDVVRRDGKRLNLCFSYADLMDHMGKVIGGVLTFIDLTPIKELEQEVCQREKLSAMGEMAIGIAHQMRNPMASIRGALEVLKEKGLFQTEEGGLVDVVFKEIDRLNSIIEDFLMYAKERKPGVRFSEIGELIDKVWLLVKQDEKWRKDIILERKLVPEHIVIQIDPDRIKQVFYNLFINALEAMPYGGKINVDVTEETQRVKIVVRDNGIGIPKERLDKIFQRFYSTKSGGLGVGLAITHRIIESHRGTIELQSEEGKGTTVTIVLPK